MAEPDGPTRSQRRLADELDEHGVDLPEDHRTAALLLEELDYARRTPMFEGRRPIYGAVVTSDPEALHRWGEADVELLDARCGLDDARTYADGRSTYLVRDPRDPQRATIACFDRALQYEADLVLLQQATGALIVQRTPVLGVSRLFQHDSVVSWNGRSWEARATARSLLPVVRRHAPELAAEVAEGVISLAIHWLAPARAGATLVVHDPAAGQERLDMAGAVAVPGLDVTNRLHYPPLLSTLQQRDLATIIDPDGTVRAVGVALRASRAALDAVANEQGMRHRSAQRWSFDHPGSIVVVVSSDGPVSVYRAGEAVLDAD